MKLLYALFPSKIHSSSICASFVLIRIPVAMLTMLWFLVVLSKFMHSFIYKYMSVTWTQSSAVAIGEYSWYNEHLLSLDKLQRLLRNLKYYIFSCLIIFHVATASFSLVNPIMPPFPFVFLLYSFSRAWSTDKALHFRLLFHCEIAFYNSSK